MTDSDPTRVVADADVLAADLLVGGSAREALDHVRSHDWLTLLASEPLFADARAVVADLASDALATDWLPKLEVECEQVDQRAGDHPAIATAIAGGAGHVLTLNERLTGPAAGVALRRYEISVRTPAAFSAVFDPAALYEATVGEAYSGPDRDPRT